VHVNVDHWKTKTHNRLRTPIGSRRDDAVRRDPPKEHTTIAST
jgi:hypothetical protein